MAGQAKKPPPEAPQQLVMPASVRAGQVLSLVEITGGLGMPIDVSKLATEFGGDIQTILPILDTAEVLGLVTTSRGDVSLTKFGEEFRKTPNQRIRLLAKQLLMIEPFKTAVMLADRRGGAKSEDIAAELYDMGVRWHHDPEVNQGLVKEILISWAITSGILSYNGKSGKFQRT